MTRGDIDFDTMDYILEHLNAPEALNDEDFIAWLKSGENQQAFERIRTYHEAFLRKEKKDAILPDAEYHRFKKRIKIRFLKTYYRIAAAVCLLIGSSLIFYLSGNKYVDEQIIVQQEVPVGKKKAELILADGQKIMLQGEAREINIGHRNIAHADTHSQLIYQQEEYREDIGKLSYHTMKIPSGADYFVQLSDGTKVWLNCETEFRYPAHFAAGERRVFMNGEAYFEVEKAGEWPFVVVTEKMEVKVTGTKFNIKSYSEEQLVHTTLLKGNVVVNGMILEPSQQFVFNKVSNTSSIEKVNARLFTGWVEGMFVFRSQTLENVMNDLAKWYGVTVFYQNQSVKNIRFSGNLGRHDTIDEVLDILRKLEKVDIIRKDKTVVISAK